MSQRWPDGNLAFMSQSPHAFWNPSSSWMTRNAVRSNRCRATSRLARTSASVTAPNSSYHEHQPLGVVTRSGRADANSAMLPSAANTSPAGASVSVQTTGATSKPTGRPPHCDTALSVASRSTNSPSPVSFSPNASPSPTGAPVPRCPGAAVVNASCQCPVASAVRARATWQPLQD